VPVVSVPVVSVPVVSVPVVSVPVVWVGVVPVVPVPVAVMTVFLPSSLVVRYATRPPRMAITARSRTGQIQSPGYHGIRCFQAVERVAIAPRASGRRSPHSRQYSW
jgi:hypothetical protein